MRIQSTVRITNRFPEITADVNRLAQEAVTAAAAAGATVARQIASSRTETGRMAGIRVERVRGSENGWDASFVSPVFYAWMQNYGTLGNRTKPLKQAPRTGRTREPGTGIEPLRFLEAGRSAGRRAMMARVRRGL